MMRIRTIAASVVLLAATAAAASAQACLGNGAFGASVASFGGSYYTTDGASGADVHLAMGRDAGYFLGGSVGYTKADGADENMIDIGVDGGREFRMNALSVCPLVGLGYSTMTDVSVLGLFGGAGLGRAFAMSPTVDIVPAAAVFYQFSRTSVTGFDADNEGDVGIGGALGFVIAHKWTLQPGVSAIVTTEAGQDIEPVWSFTVSYKYGRR